MSTIYKKYRREWSTLVALLITFVLFSALEPSYLSGRNIWFDGNWNDVCNYFRRY